MNVSVPLLTQLTTGSEIRIGRALTQSVTWDNHVCDVRCYSGFTVSEFILYCIQSLKLSGSADCYSIQRKDGTELPSLTPIPFSGFQEKIMLVNKNALKKPPPYVRKPANPVSGIAGCPPVFTIEIGISGIYSNMVVKKDDSVKTVLRHYLQDTLKDIYSEDLVKNAVLQCNNHVLNKGLKMYQCGVVRKRLDCPSY